MNKPRPQRHNLFRGNRPQQNRGDQPHARLIQEPLHRGGHRFHAWGGDADHLAELADALVQRWAGSKQAFGNV